MNREGLAGYFRKDISTLCILALLEHAEELYGYELMQQLSRYTEGTIAMPEGTLYPILYRLEEQGCVVSEKRQIGKRMQRVYYRITADGIQYLQELKTAYAATVRGVDRLFAACAEKEAEHDA